MEIKCSGAIPLWMVEILSRERIFKTSFSKYGNAYMQTVLQNNKFDFAKELSTNA
jgi:hypothetical protein